MAEIFYHRNFISSFKEFNGSRVSACFVGESGAQAQEKILLSSQKGLKNVGIPFEPR